MTGKACAEQVQYATSVATSAFAANTEQAVDGSLMTAATLSAPALGASRLRLVFSSMVQSGGRVGLVIQAGSTLDVSLLNNMSIRTYMNSNSGYEENIAVNSLVTLSALSGGKANVEFTAGKPFNQIELRVGGLINASLDVDLFAAYAPLAAPLPVELAIFQGKSTAAGTSLSWSTASERNSDYFVVERADDSPESFRAIGQVQGVGTASQLTQYSFVDARPKSLCYYRLRQVDRDGTSSISPVVVVKNAAFSQRLVVYPSLTIENVTVMGVLGTRFALCDQLGRQLQTGEVLASQSVLDVRALPAGIYFVRDLSTGTSTRFVRSTR
ncbi:hypothetical protein ACFP2F_15065 [Hymenobacter artigasi]